MRSSRSWIVMLIISATLSAIFTTVVESSSSSKGADKIVKLPGQQDDVSFQQYAGYVTVDETQKRQLFYYFVEAETNSSSKPLVLWLNGGPGCSSVGAGAFTEHGPFRPHDGGANLVRNHYSWNKEANMIYLESPAGVGFSYSVNQSFYDLVNDTITANDNLVFIHQWLLKFPEYNNRDFYITGESYAGHYVPQIAQLFLESGKNLNLKAIAIGNPLLEFDTDFNGEGKYYWSHSLISDNTYRLINTICNTSQLRREATSGILSKPCITVATRIASEIPPRTSFNNYDVTSDVCLDQTKSVAAASQETLAAAFHPFSALRSSQVARRNFKSEESVDVCTEDDTGAYLNRKDVQKAMHAKLVNIPGWNSCSNVVNYDYGNLETPTIGVLGSLVGSGIRVLVYSGDQDAVLPFIGTKGLVNRLAKQAGLNTTVSYKAWFDDDKQVGGWTRVYGENKLEFATIRGGSHLAPYSSPKRSLALFARFIAGISLAS